MVPASLSATALTVATQCLARYAAENMGKNRTGGSEPAQLGTSCHNALETYVKTCYMEGPRQEPTLKYLLDLYKMNFMITFDSIDPEGPWYEDGVELLTKWHARTSFDGFTVYSVEDKIPFPVTVTDDAGEVHRIPFNYIFDRLDQLDETTYRVVDYKTWRMTISADDLKKKLQARAYALACQIQFPHAQKIWVQFDQLRGDAVGIVFTREENINTFRYIQKWAKTILNTKIEDVTETVNSDCKWCIRKTSCDALKRNVGIGGVAGLPIPTMIDRRAQIADQMSALEWAAKELDEQLVNAAKAEDVEQLSSDNHRVYWTRAPRRAIERMDVLESILGEGMMERVGKTSVTMTQLDKLLKSKELTDEQKAQIKALVVTNYGEPRLKVAALNKIDG